MTNEVRIVTDSAADLSPEIADQHGIFVVPLSIRFDEQEFLDGVELSNHDFWEKMAQSKTLPSTAAPSPGAFEQVFRQAANEGAKTVVCISLSSELSGTYQSAVQASRALNGELDVRVIDSQSCAIAQAALCIEAAEAAAKGLSADEVVFSVEDLHSRSYLFAALDTLENLKKGGRIGTAGAFFGSILSVKPIVTLRDGKVQADSRQRTRSRALEYLVKQVADRAPVSHIYVAHSNAPDVDHFLDLLHSVSPNESIEISHLGPVVGTHTGPGLIAVSFAQEKT